MTLFFLQAKRTLSTSEESRKKGVDEFGKTKFQDFGNVFSCLSLF
jgi:hypothetical protein